MKSRETPWTVGCLITPRQHSVNNIRVENREFVTQRFPTDWLVNLLIKSGAPINWKPNRNLFRVGDAKAEDVEFAGTIFRTTLIDETIYHWNRSANPPPTPPTSPSSLLKLANASGLQQGWGQYTPRISGNSGCLSAIRGRKQMGHFRELAIIQAFTNR